MTPQPGTATAAFSALGWTEREEIALAFAPLAKLTAQLAPLTFQLAEMRAQIMRNRVWAASPRDHRPAIRRLFRSLDALPPDEARAAMQEALHYLDDAAYRLAPSGRAWAIVWTFWQTLRGCRVDLSPALLAETQLLHVAVGPRIERTSRRARVERRPLLLASRLSANAPPWSCTSPLGPP